MSDIKVMVTKYKDRKNYVMYYDCPMTGKRVPRSTKKSVKRDAEKVAAVWEDELRNGRYKPNSNITWEEFRERYETEVLASLADNTANIVATVFNAVERICNPKKLSALTSDRLSYFQKELRHGDIKPKTNERKPRREATIKCYLRHLRAALNWAVEMEMLSEAPSIKMPKRAKTSKVMKGRPITAEEFERMLDKVESALFERQKRPGQKMKMSAPRLAPVVKAKVVASWQQLLTGLWLSGLRLGEALELYWDRYDKLMVDLDGRRPMFRILAELEKGNENRLLPMTPDFAEFLQTTAKANRTGSVFCLLGVRGQEVHDSDYVSRTICKIGKAAGVKVNTESNGKVKFASAHDLRRAFGLRWAPRVMPIVLQQLMRHESIETTLKYYVGQDAESMADAVWAAVESTADERINTFVNTSDSRHSSPSSLNTKKAASL